MNLLGLWKTLRGPSCRTATRTQGVSRRHAAARLPAVRVDLAAKPMTAEGTFYRDLAYVFGAAVVGGAIARVLRQPLILGYVLGGILVGPFTPGPTVADVHEFEVLAEIGVILLMYSIGLEFSFRDLFRVKWVAILGAPVGILLSIALGLGVGSLFGWTWQCASPSGPSSRSPAPWSCRDSSPSADNSVPSRVRS